MSQPGLRQGNRTQGLGRYCSSTKASVAKEDWTERHENYYMFYNSHTMRFQKTMYLVVTPTPLTLKL